MIKIQKDQHDTLVLLYSAYLINLQLITLAELIEDTLEYFPSSSVALANLMEVFEGEAKKLSKKCIDQV